MNILSIYFFFTITSNKLTSLRLICFQYSTNSCQYIWQQNKVLLANWKYTWPLDSQTGWKCWLEKCTPTRCTYYWVGFPSHFNWHKNRVVNIDRMWKVFMILLIVYLFYYIFLLNFCTFCLETLAMIDIFCLCLE